jgi:hypothetical protein
MFGNNPFIGFLVAASSPTQLRRKAEVPRSCSGLRDGRSYKRRCVYPGTETERARERERESYIRFEFRFVSLLVITQCLPAQRFRCASLPQEY